MHQAIHALFMHYLEIRLREGKEGDQWETGKELTYEHLSPETHRAGGFTNVISQLILIDAMR